MAQLSVGHWAARLVYVAAKLELADLLAKGPRTAEDLAAAAGVRAPALYRVLRALASLGVFAEMKGRRFKLTPLGATLRADVPGSMWSYAVVINETYLWDAWGELLHGVRTGETPFLEAHGMPPFAYLEQHPDDREFFGDSMTTLSSIENPCIVAAYEFSKFGTLVDVGGGHGSLLAAILEANRTVKGVLFDQPSVIAHARKDRYVTAHGIAERCTLQSGSFFQSVPSGGDAYLMKYVLHDWSDEECVRILANCRDAMNAKGRVLVADTVIPSGTGAAWGKLLDIHMLVIGGRERTKPEFAALFAKAGLKLTRVAPVQSPLSIVEGVRA